MRFGDCKGLRRAAGRRIGPGTAALAGTLVLVGLVGCGHSTPAAPPTTIAPTTTTSTTVPVASSLMVTGVRPAVLQAPFYPQVTVSQVSCGLAPKGGRFVRIDLPAGGTGTAARSVLTKPTAVIVVSGAALLVDPRYITRALYVETMKSIATSSTGDFVLTLHDLLKTGGDGLSVVAGNVQVVGHYECPTTDVAYPGT